MSMRMTVMRLALGSIVLLVGTGCVFVGFTGPAGFLTSPRVWTEATEEIRIDTTRVTGFQVRTHNGAITWTGGSGSGSTAVVRITRKAGGPSRAEAEDALAAIEIVSEPAGDGLHRLGWRWSRPRGTGWRARVSFAVQAPSHLGFDGKTHNGRIEVSGVTADVKAVTYNGPVEVASEGGRLHARTHNGRIVARYAGEDVTLQTHNGGVVADLSGCGSVAGRLTTHNGSVEVTLGRAASARLACETHRGRIAADVPLRARETTRGRMTGIVGDGDGDLVVRTHNGGIRIKKAAG